MLTLQERVQQAIAAGFSKTQLAQAAGVSLSAVSQWLSGGTVTLKGASAAGLSALTGWSVTWWAEGRGPRNIERLIAHPVSQNSIKIDPQEDHPMVEWGAMDKDTLPEVFCVEVPDDAMADRVLKGHLVKFDKRLEPRAGDGVLVADASGAWYFRIYAPGAQGRFSAVAVKAGHQPLDNERDGLQVLAVMTGMPQARWG